MAAFLPSKFQQALFTWIESGTGSSVVTAVAGSGKSTTLGHALACIPEHKSVHIFAFNSTIAKDFKERIVRMAEQYKRPLAHVRASTFHSVGFAVIAKYLGKPAPTVNVPPSMTSIAWRVEAVRAFLTGSKPEVTREMATTTSQIYTYSSAKLCKSLDFTFRPVEESIREICSIYLSENK